MYTAVYKNSIPKHKNDLIILYITLLCTADYYRIARHYVYNVVRLYEYIILYYLDCNTHINGYYN